MRKFVIKALLFSLPVVFLYLFTLFYYTTDKGDLIRIGYIINGGDYRSVFKNELKHESYFTNVSNVNFDYPQNFTVLTIGDSFSGQKGFGYKNYLAQKSNISVLHLDSFLSDNPIQTLYGLLNGNMLDKIKVNYIILQSVEREFVIRGKNIDMGKIISINSLEKRIKKNNYLKSINQLNNSKYKYKFPFIRIIKFPLQNILYLFDDNAYHSDCYKVKTKENLFSVNTNNLLFLSTDLINTRVNNDVKEISILNDKLNDLSKKCGLRGIKLIVLPSPDKFDFYYDYIIGSNIYPKPLFFERFDKLPKKYVYINSKKILKQYGKNQKDLYFYDDTHWSPWSSKIIANELGKVICKNYN